MKPIQLLGQLIVDGGAIVSSGECSEMEIADAQATGRFAVDAECCGYVRRTKEWLALQLEREKAHPNTDGKYSGHNVKEHAPLSAGAHVNHGFGVKATGDHLNRAADRGCCVSTCSASSFDGVVSAIDDILSLLIQCDVKGYKLYGKSLMETATWERSIALLRNAKLLNGERGEVLSRKLKKGLS